MYVLTDKGREKVSWYMRELKAKRKEILDARLDTADETTLPDIEDIEADLNWDVLEGRENEGYLNGWGVTDNYNGDLLSLEWKVDFERAS